MRALLAFLFLGVVLCSLKPMNAAFEDYVTRFNKTYSAEEYQIRFSAFQMSHVRIARLNRVAKLKGFNTHFAINKFSDLTPSEFNSMYKGYRPSKVSPQGTLFEASNVSVPNALDWRNNNGVNVVTAVKDQQQCGSCWAFSATEGVESAWILAKKGTVDNTILSPQQIVSCDKQDAGCNGGDLPTAFDYVKSHGLEDDADYPYTSGGGNTGSCKFNSADVVAKITGFQYATQSQDENQMQAAMVTAGPLSICVDAETWQDYSSGIIKNNCGTSLDHCVQLVGWNSDASGTPYWIVRNSWGESWGLDGYIWIERGSDLCGIAMEATFVTV